MSLSVTPRKYVNNITLKDFYGIKITPTISLIIESKDLASLKCIFALPPCG